MQLPKPRGSRGEALRDLREGRGLTQSQLARAIGVENQSISLWENDKVNIHADNLLKLVEFFGVEPSVLGYVLPNTTPPPQADIGAMLARIDARTTDLPTLMARLDLMAEQLDRIESALKHQQDHPASARQT
jgi:transcriptional regulator with XRE-family HTH domain